MQTFLQILFAIVGAYTLTGAMYCLREYRDALKQWLSWALVVAWVIVAWPFMVWRDIRLAIEARRKAHIVPSPEYLQARARLSAVLAAERHRRAAERQAR